MSDEVIDEDLQSRQMAVYGRESMQKLRKSSVLISGMNGLGAEIAKNVVLANVKAVTLHDDKAVAVGDCGAHFYLTPADAGKNRAAVCVQQMQELNPGVDVKAMEGAFPLGDLQRFTMVVAIDMPLELAKQVDEACRACSPPIAFIRTDVRGLCGSIFVDLGPSFTCHDPTGEAIKSAIVESIYPLKEAPDEEGRVKLKVQCVDDDDLSLDDGASALLVLILPPHHHHHHRCCRVLQLLLLSPIAATAAAIATSNGPPAPGSRLPALPCNRLARLARPVDGDALSEGACVVRAMCPSYVYVCVYVLSRASTGDYITFSEVEGLVGLNGIAPVKVDDVSKGRKCFTIAVPSAAASGSYTRGGLISERRQPKQLEYVSLAEFLQSPGDLWEVDESKMAPAATSFSEEFLGVFGSPKANICYGRSGLLHLGFRALDAYAAKHGALPPSVDAAAADAVFAAAQAINANVPDAVAQLDLPERATVRAPACLRPPPPSPPRGLT